MRVINRIPWTPTEIESYRQIIWANLIEGMTRIREVMDELNIETSRDNIVRRARSLCWNTPFLVTPVTCTDRGALRPQALFDQVVRQCELGGEQPYPPQYQHILQTLWDDSAVQQVCAVPSAHSLALLSALLTTTPSLPQGRVKGQETRSPRQVRSPVTALIEYRLT